MGKEEWSHRVREKGEGGERGTEQGFQGEETPSGRERAVEENIKYSSPLS